MATPISFTATCSRGMEPVVAKELRRMGLNRVTEERSAVRFMGSLSDGYRACLWSRSASRILMRLNRFECTDADALYDGVRQIDWHTHLGPNTTFAVDFVGGSKTIRHSQFGARKAKDAIADQMRDALGSRPDVNLRNPDLPVHIHLSHAVATVSLDLCGAPLHLRGHGRSAGIAPLRETLAASMLLLADWPRAAQKGRPLLDPMCGSGTLLIEAAGMAADQAPGLSRSKWAFQSWLQHNPTVWTELLEEAETRAQAETTLPPIRGRDLDGKAIGLATENIQKTGWSRHIQIEQGSLKKARPRLGEPTGVLVTNPPYGDRLGEDDEVLRLHQDLGDRLRRSFLGWDAWILCGRKEWLHALSLKPSAKHIVFNGPLECRYVHLPISLTPPKDKPRWRDPGSSS